MLISAVALLWGCAGDAPSKVESTPSTDPEGTTTGCLRESFEIGDPDGHPDVFGAAAGQARAGRIASAADLPQPAHGRQEIEAGDFVLANDQIAVVVEDVDLSDGYGRFGGELLAVDLVGPDGRPRGESRYVETLVSLGMRLPDPTSVSVLRDGSDGGEAVVRVVGETLPAPFLGGPLAALFEAVPQLRVAYDYVLAPGSPALVVRLGIANGDEEDIDLGAIEAGSAEIFGFFQSSHNQIAAPGRGFAVGGTVPWLGFVNEGDAGFAWRSLQGDLLLGIDVSGFSWVTGPGLLAEACAISTSDRVQIVVGGPEYDGLLAAVRAVDGDASWRTVEGRVLDAGDLPVAGAYVHETETDGGYLSRTRTREDGTFTLHVPPDRTVRLTAQSRGYVHGGLELLPGEDDPALRLEPHGHLHVTATDPGGTPLPVRIQVIPAAPLPPTPDSWGVPDEIGGRLHQSFAMDGDETLVVPPGEHRVVVSRGYEWELLDETVSVEAGGTTEVRAVLEHSVDSTGWMCADFHIHSRMSADSDDPIDDKVRSAVADGLEIPVSSEHEWVVDFGPVVERLGLGDWAYGMPSSELTTFAFGHFGVVPTLPEPGGYNRGATDWIGLDPAGVFARVHARPERPALIVNHPSSSGFGGYFSAAGLDPVSGEAASPELWSLDFDAVEVFNDSTLDDNRQGSVADWFSLLDHGVRVSAVGNSDSHHLRSSPVGYPRTCFPFGHDDPRALTHEAVRDAILAGSGTVSGGLLLTVQGAEGERPGDTIDPGEHTFEITVASPSWIEASELEVIVSGETLSTAPLVPTGAGPGRRYLDTITVTLDPGDWIVLHARGAGDLAPLHPGRAPFAVSNPIYVR